MLDKSRVNDIYLREKIKILLNEKNMSIRELSKELKADQSNLSKTISGRRNNTKYLEKTFECLTKK